MKKATTLLVACIGLTVFSGVLRGRMDARWGGEEMTAAANRVESIPQSLGNWQAAELHNLDEAAKRMLRCEGDVVGSYVDQSSNDLVSMVFLVGPTGPLAVHTPDVCYGSSNFTIAEKKRKKVIIDSEGESHEFSVITFKENRAGNRLFRVYYAWNHDGEWKSPPHPRTSFAGIPMLFKIQIATNVILQTKDEVDAGERFLQQNLPLLDEIYK